MEKKRKKLKAEDIYICPFCWKNKNTETIIVEDYEKCPVCGANLVAVCHNCGSKKPPALMLCCVDCGEPTPTDVKNHRRKRK